MYGREREREREKERERSLDNCYNFSEDEEEAIHRIFGSSDSESEFEAFVAQSKQQKAPSRRPSEHTGEELPIPAKEKASKAKGKQNLKVKKEVNIEDSERTPSIIMDEANLKSEQLEKDKENRMEVEIDVPKKPSKPVPRRPQFKKRPTKGEEEILGSFLEKGLDKEDVLMMKLAFAKLKGMGDEMVEGMHWSYYPHNILSVCVCVCVCVCVF